MKKLLLLSICLVAVIMSCKNKGQSHESEDNDSVQAEVPDTAPRPMFLYTHDREHMQVIYWTDDKEPAEDDISEADYTEVHKVWDLQQSLRRNAAKYTSIVRADKSVVGIKYVGEVVKNPDGGKMYPGELHSRAEIPAPGARYALQDPKLYKKDLEGMSVIVCDEYLQTRKALKVTESQNKSMPQDVVAKMEKKYGMKATHSVRNYSIEGGYLCGAIQFKGEYKNAPKFPGEDNQKIKKALALEVLVKGDSVWVLEQIGTLFPGEGPSWNAEDGGEYFPNSILAAFDGPQGLELCYSHDAPESIEVGMLYPRGEKLEKQTYAIYHSLIDEEIPVWKKDIAEMNKLFQKKDNEVRNVKLTKWAHVWMGDDTEWIHMADKNETYGAIFTRKNGKFQLIRIEWGNEWAVIVRYQGKGYLKFAYPAGGPTWATEICGYEDGKQVEQFNMLEVEGEIDEASLNDKSISDEAARTYVSKFSKAEKLNTNWNEADE